MPGSNQEFIALLEQIRWNGKPTCPYCGSTKATVYKQSCRYHCNSCFTAYSVTVGTLFHKTHVELAKWFEAIYLISKFPETSVRKLSKEIGVSKNTASYMILRIRQVKDDDKYLLEQILKFKKS